MHNLLFVYAYIMNLYLYEMAIEWIPPGVRVLDLGPGNGSFLARLIADKGVEGEAVEKDKEHLASCIEKGLPVYQGDILDGLDQYGSKSFDYILLLGTFQELPSPEKVLQESFRVGHLVILAFSNFAYWRARLHLMIKGISPVLDNNATPWYESPNIQFFSSIDFHDFCRAKGIKQLKNAYFNSSGSLRLFPNLRAEETLCLLKPK